MRKILILFLIMLIGLTWLSPSAIPALGIIFLLFSLTIAIYTVFNEYRNSENLRAEIFHSVITTHVLLLITIFILIIFLGGLAGLIANSYASPQFGTVVGFIAAIMSSFLVGYFIRTGVGKFIKS